MRDVRPAESARPLLEQRPPVGGAWLLVAVAIFGISLSAPITAVIAISPLAVAFWRSALGALATAPVAVRQRGRLFALSALTWRNSLLAGVMLAVHFGTWLSSLRLTSVTAATALCSSTPLWSVGFDLIRRVRVPSRVLLGVLTAMVGVLAITGVDAQRSSRALIGDVLALVGGITTAGYVVFGERALRRTSTPVYTMIAYTTCACLLLPVCLGTGAALDGYSRRSWIELGILTVGAQIIGHTLLNTALPHVGRTPLALAILLEVPGATLVAAVWLGQRPPLSVLPGTVLMLAGLVILVRRSSPQPEPAEERVVEVT